MKPTHTLLHISDTHFGKATSLLHGAIDTENNLRNVFSRLTSSDIVPDALVFTGDLANDGLTEAYQNLRAMVEPICDRYGAEIVWVMGNHDSRPEFRNILMGQTAVEDPVDYEVMLNGLRLIVLDSTVPGHHHGEISDSQYAWLADRLRVPATHGTILVLHHPPIPTPLAPLELVELRERDRLSTALQGTDVRGVLAGHLHYSAHSTLPEGVPVSVAGATCYTHDPKVQNGLTAGVDGGQSFNLVEVYPDRVAHSIIPLHQYPKITEMTVASIRSLMQQSHRHSPLSSH